MERAKGNLTLYAWLSIGAAVATITLKSLAFLLTGSLGLLSDALESVVNLVGSMMALAMIAIAMRPPDQDHTYGHSKAEYFSSGLEGVLIFIAGISIIAPAVYRLIYPVQLSHLAVGILISVIASGINLGAALVLKRAGRRYGSVALQSNAEHLLTDVWTTGAVVVGVVGVKVTGWTRLDPLVALIVGFNIMRRAWQILAYTVGGLMDKAIPDSEQDKIKQVFSKYESQGIGFHGLQTRQAGNRKFVSFHVLVPGSWTVMRGHELLDELEDKVRKAVPGSVVFTHLEPIESPTSWDAPAWERNSNEGAHVKSQDARNEQA